MISWLFTILYILVAVVVFGVIIVGGILFLHELLPQRPSIRRLAHGHHRAI